MTDEEVKQTPELEVTEQATEQAEEQYAKSGKKSKKHIEDAGKYLYLQ